MNKYGLAVLAVSVALLMAAGGCNSKSHSTTEVTSDTVHFYPVNEYIISQINYVDSAANMIYKITVRNGVKDSTVLNKPQFKQLAQAFLEQNISDKNIHKYYKESTFMDDATRSYTINYTSADSSLPLQSVNVLLDVASSEVKRVFLSKQTSTGGSTIIEKEGWKNNESFFINRVTETNGATTTEQNMVVWHTEP